MEAVSFVSLFLKQVLIILLLHTVPEVLMQIYVLLTCSSEFVFLYCMFMGLSNSLGTQSAAR